MFSMYFYYFPLIVFPVRCNDTLPLGCRHCEVRSNPLPCTIFGYKYCFFYSYSQIKSQKQVI